MYLCLGPEVVFVGLSDFWHGVGFLVDWALYDKETNIDMPSSVGRIARLN